MDDDVVRQELTPKPETDATQIDVSKLIETLRRHAGDFRPGSVFEEAAAALTAERERADNAEDLTWFWQIVDADGLTGVPSAERAALDVLVRRAAERDDLTRKLQTTLDRESATTARYDAKIDDLTRKLAEAVAERDALVQTSAELCERCGWRMKFPNEECRNCHAEKLDEATAAEARATGMEAEYDWLACELAGLDALYSQAEARAERAEREVVRLQKVLEDERVKKRRYWSKLQKMREANRGYVIAKEPTDG